MCVWCTRTVLHWCTFLFNSYFERAAGGRIRVVLRCDARPIAVVSLVKCHHSSCFRSLCWRVPGRCLSVRVHPARLINGPLPAEGFVRRCRLLCSFLHGS